MNATQSHLHTGLADLNRLHLALQRLVDADLLLEEEAAPLRACIEATGRSPGPAPPDEIRGLQERLVALVNGLSSPNPQDVVAEVLQGTAVLAVGPEGARQPGALQGSSLMQDEQGEEPFDGSGAQAGEGFSAHPRAADRTDECQAEACP